MHLKTLLCLALVLTSILSVLSWRIVTKRCINNKPLSRMVLSDAKSSGRSVADSPLDVVIIGAGMAGLSCANYITKSNSKANILVVDSADKVGGRVGSEIFEGFILDKGFQVFIDSYPEAQTLLDYDALMLGSFRPGASIRLAGEFGLVSDPFRRPQDILPSLVSPIGSFIDKIKVGLLSIIVRTREAEDILSRDDSSTKEYLTSTLGVSDLMINAFFRPFYQGIFLSAIEQQSSRMFEWLFKMFTIGQATLPANGMQAIPDQLAARLPRESLLLSQKVESIELNKDGVYKVTVMHNANKKETKSILSRQVVIATDPKTAKFLCDSNLKQIAKKQEVLTIPTGRGSTCIYYAIDGRPPVEDPILILNGENKLMPEDDIYPVAINNVCFPNTVCPTYAPEGKSLASVTVVGTFDDAIVSAESLELSIRSQLEDWWGPSVRQWKLLKIYRIPYAQPAQVPPFTVNDDTSVEEYAPNLYVVGDHRSSPTLHGAIRSGRLVAEKLTEKLTAL